MHWLPLATNATLYSCGSILTRDVRDKEMKYILTSLCIACLLGCRSEPNSRPTIQLPQPREMSPQDATLFLSALKGDVAEMRKAIRSGGNINTRQWGLCSAMFMTDATPLYAAVTSKNPAAVEFLLDHGADPLLPNFHKETPLELAMRLKQDDITKLLKKISSNHRFQTIDAKASQPEP